MGGSLDGFVASLLATTALCQVQGGHQEVDRLDADEGDDDTAEPVDQEVAAEQRAGTDGAVGDALQRQRDQGDDDQRIDCLLYTSPSPRDGLLSRMPSSA